MKAKEEHDIGGADAVSARPRRYAVTGMHCSACSTRVERAVSKLPGVTSCAVSVLTNEMSVEGTATDDEIVTAVVKAGFGCELKIENEELRIEDGQTANLLNSQTSNIELQTSNSHTLTPSNSHTLTPSNSQTLKPSNSQTLNGLIASIVLVAILMYATMGHMMLGWPLPLWFTQPEPNHVAMGIAQMILAGAVLFLNRHFFSSGFRAVLRGSANMDTLVALGSGTAYAWSVVVLFIMTRAQIVDGTPGAEAWMKQFYFESAAMIVTLISVGKLLEERAKGRTTSALAALLRLAPKKATVVRDGREAEIPVAQVRKDDIFLVRPGESIPVDGVVVEGESAINESALTGESVPVDKAPGATVSAATSNISGFLRCRATRVGEDTTLAQIVRLMKDAAVTKAPIARLADRVSAVFVPTILLLALITLGIWLVCGAEAGTALARAISVLVVSCPCALGLATPVAIMVGSGVGARRGILFKTAAALEAAGRSQIVVLDKTGTITTGEPQVVGVFANDEDTYDSDERKAQLLAFAAALERGSEHPLAKAIVKAAPVEMAELRSANFRALPGCGVEASINGALAFGGSVKATIERGIAISPTLLAAAEEAAAKGATPLVFARNCAAIGVIAVADTLKPDTTASVRELRDMGLRVLLLTGDNERTARAVATEAGIDEVIAGVLPDGKHNVVEDLKRNGRVAMVGDGVNDAPALAAADLGLAIGAGTDVAIDAAGAVLVHNKLSDVVAALRLGRATLRNIRENLFWAFLYNILLIPLAAGAFIPLFGWRLSPDLCALVHGISSVCVVANALTLGRK